MFKIDLLFLEMNIEWFPEIMKKMYFLRKVSQILSILNDEISLSFLLKAI